MLQMLQEEVFLQQTLECYFLERNLVKHSITVLLKIMKTNHRKMVKWQMEPSMRKIKKIKTKPFCQMF